MDRRMIITTAAALALALPGSALASYDGELDDSFGGDGRVTSNVDGVDWAEDIAVQPDGKIVAAGTARDSSGDGDFAVARYTATGQPDPSFGGGDGEVTTGFGGDDDRGEAVAIQADGKIVVAGQTDEDGDTDFAVARYLPNGDLDDDFSDDGKRWFGFGGTFPSQDEAHDVAIQRDGKIVVVGEAASDNPYNPSDFMDEDFAVARLEGGDGDLDSHFALFGKVKTGLGGSDVARGVAVQADGAIVVVGERQEEGDADFALARYLPNGFLDDDFAGDGKLSHGVNGYDAARAVAIQGDRKILIAGKTTSDAAVLRYNPDGSRDTAFGTQGTVETGFFSGKGAIANDLALQADGRIVIAGESTGYFVAARYDRDGELDPSFEGNGKLATDFGGYDGAAGVAIQRDGRIVAAGGGTANHDFALARYLGDEPPDTRITGGPAEGAYITDSTPTFSFTSPGGGVSFECALRASGPYFGCNSPYTTPVLSDGAHYFYVRAKETSGSGRRDPTPAYRQFTVDTVPPETTIDDVDIDAEAHRATVRFSGIDPDPGSTPLRFRCRLDDGGYQACTSPLTIIGLTPGTHKLKVRASDRAGNEDPTSAKANFEV